MLFIIGLISCIFSLLFYCKGVASGLGRKRWALGGMLFGPMIWPMFKMKKRMKTYKLFGFNSLIFRA